MIDCAHCIEKKNQRLSLLKSTFRLIQITHRDFSVKENRRQYIVVIRNPRQRGENGMVELNAVIRRS